LGKFEFDCQADSGPVAKISAAVSPDIVDALIGKKDMVSLGILPHDFPAVHHCKPDTIPIGSVKAIKVERNPLTVDQITDIEKAIARLDGDILTRRGLAISCPAPPMLW
jgi:hypothetical protein